MSTPTKAAEIIREALEELREPDWTQEYKDKIIDRALAILADMEREGEPVAWDDGDIEAAYLAGCINGASQEATGKTYWPSLDRVQAELQRLKDNGISIPSMIRSMRNKAHPSPTAADAPPDPDAHIADQEQYLKAKQERAKGVDFEESRTPVAYAMSKDYDKLYELLCAGVGAFCFVDFQWDKNEVLRDSAWIKREGEWRVQVGARGIGYGDVRPYHHRNGEFKDERKEVVAMCKRLNLEWIAPVDVAEVIKAGDELTKLKGALCNFILSLAPRDRDGHFSKDELDRMTARWATATNGHCLPLGRCNLALRQAVVGPRSFLFRH